MRCYFSCYRREQVNGRHRSHIPDDIGFSPADQKVAAETKITGSGNECDNTHHKKSHDEGKNQLEQFSGLGLGYGVHVVLWRFSNLGILATIVGGHPQGKHPHFYQQIGFFNGCSVHGISCGRGKSNDSRVRHRKACVGGCLGRRTGALLHGSGVPGERRGCATAQQAL